jgi:hypothetical protein
MTPTSAMCATDPGRASISALLCGQRRVPATRRGGLQILPVPDHPELREEWIEPPVVAAERSPIAASSRIRNCRSYS